jgi:hypothetical protein
MACLFCSVFRTLATGGVDCRQMGNCLAIALWCISSYPARLLIAGGVVHMPSTLQFYVLLE